MPERISFAQPGTWRLRNFSIAPLPASRSQRGAGGRQKLIRSDLIQASANGAAHRHKWAHGTQAVARNHSATRTALTSRAATGKKGFGTACDAGSAKAGNSVGQWRGRGQGHVVIWKRFQQSCHCSSGRTACRKKLLLNCSHTGCSACTAYSECVAKITCSAYPGG